MYYPTRGLLRTPPESYLGRKPALLPIGKVGVWQELTNQTNPKPTVSAGVARRRSRDCLMDTMWLSALFRSGGYEVAGGCGILRGGGGLVTGLEHDRARRDLPPIKAGRHRRTP
jgi:hypothetical protein